MRTNIRIPPENSKKTIVIKIGGSIEQMPEIRNGLCEQITELSLIDNMRLVLVHGGGKEISSWLDKLQKKALFKDGLRVTDDETMELVEMVLAGKVNGEIVESLRYAGCKAAGLSGRSAGILEASVINYSNYGRAGKVTKTDTSIIETLLAESYVPVIAPLGSCPEFGAVNINADTAAAGIASSLEADYFILLTDVDGLYADHGTKDQSMIISLTNTEVRNQIDTGLISGGMIPKLKSCLTAIENGANKVIICNGAKENILIDWIRHGSGCGTQIIRR